MLDQEAWVKGLWKEDLDRSDVINIFTKCKGVFGIPELTRTKRERNFVTMAWSPTIIVKERNQLKKVESGGGIITNEDDNEVNTRQGMEDNGIDEAGGRRGGSSSSNNNDEDDHEDDGDSRPLV